jgi:hypothetical protein
MPTYEELSKLTNGQLEKFTYDQLNRLTNDELLIIANSQAEDISHLNPESGKHIKSILETIAIGLATNVIYDVAKSVDWSSMLKHLILFLQSFNN